MVQGINKEYIFNTVENKNEFLNLILANKSKFKILLLAYCIMDNHAHLLIYSDNIYEISAYMKTINCRFAKFYNLKNNRVGYVFRDRFNSQYINNQLYLLKCLNYIHMNPVKANMVSKPEYYTYSSYNDFLKSNNIVNKKVLEKLFGDNQNYLDEFLNISNEEIEIMDIDRKDKNFKIAVQLFLNENNTTVDKLKKNNQLIKKFCETIIIKKSYNQQQVSNFLGFSPSKICRIIYSARKKSV
jgi:putative transposase